MNMHLTLNAHFKGVNNLVRYMYLSLLDKIGTYWLQFYLFAIPENRAWYITYYRIQCLKYFITSHVTLWSFSFF